ncbi:MAG: CBS domain-containing protein [Candidatus Rokubacteria bacterium]|nr:CBS domain-containing protein [Candidatus Rokubacteria bacterium]
MKHPKRAITRDIRTRRPKRAGRQPDELEALTWPEKAIRVGELMVRSPLTVRWDRTIGAAWKLMKERKIRHLPVLDDHGRLVGIVTDRDLRQVIFEPSIQEQLGNLPQALNVLTVKEVMTWGVVTVQPQMEIREAARIMHEQKIGALPVVEGGKVVGMLTETDVLKVFVKVLEEGIVSKPERWGPVK